MQPGPTSQRRYSLGQALWFLCLVTLLSLGARALTVHALPSHNQATISVLENERQHVFKGPMTFRLVAESGSKINSVELFYRVAGQSAAHKVNPEFEPGVRIEIEYIENMDTDDNYQPPMTTFT